MKKMAFIILIFIIIPFVNSENNDFKVYLFWSEGCPHCEAEKEYLNEIKDNYPGMEIIMYEATGSIEEYNLLKEFCDAYDVTFITPLIFIGNDYVSGFVDKETTGLEIKEKLDYCLEHGCIDPIDKVKGIGKISKGEAVKISKTVPEVISLLEEYPNASYIVDIQYGTNNYMVRWRVKDIEISVEIDSETGEIVSGEKNKEEEQISIPFIGDVYPSEINLPLLTIMVGGLDGINPCAIWVLCFLMSFLIYMRDKKRMLIVGVTFVITSGIVYFMFMAAWLNFFLLVGYVDVMRIAIAILAITVGIINVKDFFFFKRGVSLTIPDSKKPSLMKRMRGLLKKESTFALILGTMALAFFANLIELLCTAGFPAIYTRILTLNALSALKYYLYLVLYNAVYVVPLMIIVVSFVVTMGRRKFTERQGRILKLVSGAIMLLLGLIMLLKPEILIVG
ncbi:hypothetical protein DRN45_03365 [Thermococci archaeon]|nr:MAG: hypothetical protein DRN45_03365 [Thermococci archaeon]